MQGQKKVNLADPQVRKRFVTYKEASELYSMGLTRIQEHAKIAGATYKMGNKVLINTDIFEAYLEQFRIPGEYEGMAKKFVPDMAGLNAYLQLPSSTRNFIHVMTSGHF